MKRSLAERFAEKYAVDPKTGCWNWTACKVRGYGMIGVTPHNGGKQRPIGAHRVAYELLVGPIPEGLSIDHLCRNRCCVNPAHMEPVTPVENVMRGIGFGAENAVKTHCACGLLLSGENLMVRRNGWRVCRACHSARERAYYQRNASRLAREARERRARKQAVS